MSDTRTAQRWVVVLAKQSRVYHEALPSPDDADEPWTSYCGKRTQSGFERRATALVLEGEGFHLCKGCDRAVEAGGYSWHHQAFAPGSGKRPKGTSRA